MKVAIIADDLTGANDSAASFASAGFKTCVAFSDFSKLPSDCEVAVADTESRDKGPSMAATAVREAVAGFAQASPEILFKKIDSTMRGSIGAELEAALKASARKFILMAPALPDSGRTTIGGCQFLQGRRLEDTELARVPKSPVWTSFIPEILDNTSRLKSVLIRTDELPQLHAILPGLLRSGVEVIICDATDNSHLKFAARAGIMNGALLCGCAGLAREVSSIVCRSNAAATTQPHLAYEAPSVLVLSGSISEITRAQTKRLIEHGGKLMRIDAALCVHDPKAAAQEVVLAIDSERQINSYGVFVVAGAWSGDDVAASKDAALSLGLSFEEAGERMARCMGAIASAVASSFDACVFTGGDTACHACSQIGATALQALGEIQSGVPLSRILTGRCEGMPIATKAGAFGDEDALCSAVDFLMKQGNYHS